MKKISIVLFAALLIAAVSCKKSTYDAGTTVATKIANGWWVTFTVNGDDIYGLGTFFLTTYNTAANGDSIWVDDLGHSWIFKGKAKADYQALTFQSSQTPNEYNGDSTFITISKGQVFPKAGHTRGGNISDSLYMEVSFSDDPSALTYVISGTARTGFIEDDY
jgi:Lipid-binding putative hydrolase